MQLEYYLGLLTLEGPGRHTGDTRSPPGSAQVGFFNIGSGRVVDKIPGSRSGSGQVGVSKNTIGYFQVSFLFSGFSVISGYFWVFLC